MSDRFKTDVFHRVQVFWMWLSKRDALPTTEPPFGRTLGGSGLWTWLAAHETLPRLPSALHDPKRRLLWVISPEDLPNQSHRDSAESRSFFRWLVRPEKLPSPPIDSVHKEASRDEP